MADLGFGMAGWGGVLESGGGGGGGGGGTPPTVVNFSPPEGTPIQKGTALTFDVLTPQALVSIVVSVAYNQSIAHEVAFNQDGFAPNFRPSPGFVGSEEQPISGGFHFILRRRGGWPGAPSIFVEGADNLGNPIGET